MLKEKQSVTAQNSQLWRLVDKQRAMILGLNKDLERAMKEKDRYRTKLKEHLGLAPLPPAYAAVADPSASSSSAAAAAAAAAAADGKPSASRALTESPAPSLDDAVLAQHRSGSPSPPPPTSRRNGVERADFLASSVERGREGYTSSALEAAIAPYSSTPSPTHPQPTISLAHERMPSPTEHSHGHTTASIHHAPNLSENPDFRRLREAALPDVLHDDEDDVMESTSIPPKTAAVPVSHSAGLRDQLERLPQVHVQSESSSQARQLSLSTAVAPAIGLGKSPFRKAPPARLELPHPQPQNQQHGAGEGRRGGGGPEGDAPGDGREDPDGAAGSWENTPEDKKGLSVPMPRFLNNGPLTAPPTRSPPAPYMQAVPLTPTPSSLDKARRLSPDADSARIKPQFVRAPLPSPGLPSSPRPIDRPAGSPLPRGSRNFSLDSNLGGFGGVPKPIFQSMNIPATIPGTPRSPMPLASSRFPLPSGHERADSDASSGSSTTLRPQDLIISPPAIATVESRVVPSRPKPAARPNMMPANKARTAEDSVFTLAVFSRADGSEILRVEKDAGTLPAVDARLRKLVSFDAKLPDRALFAGSAPARVDARRAAIDEYFAGALAAALSDERAALVLCEFFSTDVVEQSSPSSATAPAKPAAADAEGSSEKAAAAAQAASNIIKEGYLTKRGKNFGGWKERYFVLDAPVLKYFDSPGGAKLGQIKLHNAQIGRQSSKSKDESHADEDNQYRHAFLVLEPKRKDSSHLVRHVLCAENDKERDEWVNALLDHVTTDKEEDVKLKPRHSKSKESKESKEARDRDRDGQDDGARIDADGSSLRSMSYDEVSQGPPPARGPTPEELNSRHQVSPSPNSMLAQQPPPQFSSTSPVPDRSHPHAPKQISAPSNGTVISDLAAWGAMKLGGSGGGSGSGGGQHDDKDAKGGDKDRDTRDTRDKKAEKAARKRSIWGFRQRSSSDLDDQLKSPPGGSQQQQQQQQTGYQQAVKRFPLSKPVFGASLEEAVYLTKPPGIDVTLPSVVYRCIEYLDAKNASEEEGIFRLSGSNAVVKGLKDKFNSGAFPSVFFSLYLAG